MGGIHNPAVSCDLIFNVMPLRNYFPEVVRRVRSGQIDARTHTSIPARAPRSYRYPH